MTQNILAVRGRGLATLVAGVLTIWMYGALQIAAAASKSFQTSITTQVAVPLPVPQAPNPALTGRLSKVRSFENVVANTPGTSGINQAIGESTADLVFLNFCSDDPPIDRAVADPSGAS